MNRLRVRCLYLLSLLYHCSATAVYKRPFRVKFEGYMRTVNRENDSVLINKLSVQIYGLDNQETRRNYVNSKSAVYRADLITSRDNRLALHFSFYTHRALWVNFCTKSPEEHVRFYHRFNNANLAKRFHMKCASLRRGLSPYTLIRQIYYEQGTSVKIPCFRCDAVRWMSGRPNFFYRMNRRTMVDVIVRGDSYTTNKQIHKVFMVNFISSQL
ncbi:unnamed protein product [Soboliphyme baturini]|uniref:Vitellogenin domain-containing protein n=1 Tax=Soboliphyme baturini TaxID=241478 RepID=A0A183J6N2_9BILA|nr:unnamed protein product [Soboliphyme baturini]